MAGNIFTAGFQALGGDMSGLLDMRQQVEASRMINPYMQEQQQIQAQRDSDLLQSQLGIERGVLDPAFQNAQGEGLSVDTGNFGLLSDPILAKRKPELQAAAKLMANPGTNALGQSLLGSILQTAQSNRTQDEATQYARSRDQQSDIYALESSALEQQRYDSEQDRIARNDRFSQGQALESDYAATFAPVKGAVDQFGLLEQSINSKSPIGLTASIFQLAKLFDPGSRTVTEGDVTTVQGAFPFQQQLATAMSKLQGGGWDEAAAADILNLAGSLTTQQIESNRPAFENFVNRAGRGEIDARDVIGRYGLETIYRGPEGTMDRFNPRAAAEKARAAQAAQDQTEQAGGRYEYFSGDAPPSPSTSVRNIRRGGR